MPNKKRAPEGPAQYRGPVTTEVAAELEAFLDACRRGRPLRLVASGAAKGYANVALTDRRERALHLAAMSPSAEAVKLLIKAGALLDERDVSEWTPLMCAMRAKNAPGARALIQAGAALNLVDDEDDPALSHACLVDFAEGVQLLAAAGAELERLGGGGDSALHYAAAEPAGFGCVKALLEAGALLDVPDRQGRTPLELARAGGAKESAELIAGEMARREASEIEASARIPRAAAGGGRL